LRQWTKDLRNTQSAHTLIELLVVVALLVLLVTLISVPGEFLSRMMVRAEVEKLRTACRYLQRRAMAEGKQMTLQFNRHTNSYGCQDEANTLPSQVVFGTLPSAKGPPSSPTRPLTSPITFEGDHITFGPEGAMQAGAVYLADRHKQCLYGLTASVGNMHLRTYCHRTRWHLLD